MVVQDPYTCLHVTVCGSSPCTYIEVDECARNSGLCAPGRCVNTLGSYRCACSQGFTTLVNTPGCLGNVGSAFIDLGLWVLVASFMHLRSVATWNACSVHFHLIGIHSCVYVLCRWPLLSASVCLSCCASLQQSYCNASSCNSVAVEIVMLIIHNI